MSVFLAICYHNQDCHCLDSLFALSSIFIAIPEVIVASTPHHQTSSQQYLLWLPSQSPSSFDWSLPDDPLFQYWPIQSSHYICCRAVSPAPLIINPTVIPPCGHWRSSPPPSSPRQLVNAAQRHPRSPNHQSYCNTSVWRLTLFNSPIFFPAIGQ